MHARRFSFIRFGVLVFVTLVLIFGCQLEEENKAQSLSLAANQRVGVYVFDGTKVKAEHNTILKRFYDRAIAYRKAYFEGTGYFATNVVSAVHQNDEQLLAGTNSIIGAGLRRICDDVATHNLKFVFLAGYSRGAIEVLSVVKKLNEGICNRPVTIRWVGLLDTVNTLIENLPSQMPPASEITCFHLHKEKKFEHLLTTKDVPFCALKEAVKGVNHWEIGGHAPSLERLIFHATQYSRRTLSFANSAVVQLSEAAGANAEAPGSSSQTAGKSDSTAVSSAAGNAERNAGGSAKDLGEYATGMETNGTFGTVKVPPPRPAQTDAECFVAETARSCLNLGCSWVATSGICQKIRR